MWGMARRVHAVKTSDSSEVSDGRWVGFVCDKCGAPLPVCRSNGVAKVERASRGWRVTCTGCGITEYHEVGAAMVTIAAS